MDKLKLHAYDRYEVISWVIAAVVLTLVLFVHLVPALLAGLLVYELVHILARRLPLGRLSSVAAKQVAVAVLSTLIVSLITLAVLGIIAFFKSDAANLPALMKKMADIIETSRAHLPPWLIQYLPTNPDALKESALDLLHRHGTEVQTVGREAGHVLVRILIGMIIGAMVSLHETSHSFDGRPLARALTERARRLGDAFRRIVFAQTKISAINTALTAIYLAVVLPLLGIHLPLMKTMIAASFITGLIPVVGNLISNTLIVVVSLSYSLPIAVASLIFLIVIHKMEYFLNARIVGTEIRSRPWELLLAMLTMEAAFGVPGLAAAPIYYAYIKDELASRNLV